MYWVDQPCRLTQWMWIWIYALFVAGNTQNHIRKHLSTPSSSSMWVLEIGPLPTNPPLAGQWNQQPLLALAASMSAIMINEWSSLLALPVQACLHPRHHRAAFPLSRDCRPSDLLTPVTLPKIGNSCFLHHRHISQNRTRLCIWRHTPFFKMVI